MDRVADNKWAKRNDDVLRPWTINEEFQSKIHVAEDDLADTITKVSYSRNGGCSGYSVLDPVPKALQDLHTLLDIVNDNLIEESGVEIPAVIEGIALPEESPVCEDEDQAMDDSDDDCYYSELELVDGKLPISAVKYKRRLGPAIANISTVQFMKLIKSMKLVIIY